MILLIMVRFVTNIINKNNNREYQRKNYKRKIVSFKLDVESKFTISTRTYVHYNIITGYVGIYSKLCYKNCEINVDKPIARKPKQYLNNDTFKKKQNDNKVKYIAQIQHFIDTKGRPPTYPELRNNPYLPYPITLLKTFNCNSIHQIYEEFLNIPHPIKKIEKAIMLFRNKKNSDIFYIKSSDIVNITKLLPHIIGYYIKTISIDGYVLSLYSNTHKDTTYKVEKIPEE